MAVAKRKVAKKGATSKAAPTRAKKASVTKTPATTKVKKAPSKKVETVKPVKISPPSKPYTLSEFIQKLTETTGHTRKEVKQYWEHLRAIIGAHLGKNGPGSVTLPGIAKITVKTKPATKARKGINPFTGVEQTFPAKPQRRIVKVRALKKMQDMV